MSLILIQETSSSVPTPVAGKGTVFLNSSSQLVVKDSSGNTSVIPSIETAGNTEVYFNDGGTISGDPNFTFNATTGTLTANYVGGTLTSAAQPNVTSVGTLTSLLTGATSSTVDFPNAIAILSEDNTGQAKADKIGAVGEAVADSGNTSITGIGVLGIGRANSATKATGVQGEAYVTNTADSGAAVGVRGYSGQTHAGGYNIGVLGNAAGSGMGNYAFYVQAGNIGSIETATGWDLVDNEGAALAFNSTGKANILAISSIDGSEGIFGTGYLSVTGNITGGNLIGALANGTSNVKVPSSGGNVTISVGGTSNVIVVTGTGANISGTISASGNANVGNLGTGGLITATGNLNAGNIITGGVISATGNANVGNIGATGVYATTVSASGNANVGNIGTGGLITATGNIQGGNLVTGGVLSATGNANVGNLGTAGLITATGNITSTAFLVGANLSITGNANVGNLGTAGLITATGNIGGGNINTAGQLVSSVATGTAPLTVTSTTRVSNLNVAYANVADNINVTAPGTGTAYIVGANATTGNVVEYTSSGISMNLATNAITATTFIGALSGTATTATTASTVTTNAQPNITSTGTLTSLSVTANANIGNIGTGGLITATGNIRGGNLVTGGVLSVTGNANIGNIGATNAVFTGTGSFGGNVNMNTTNIVNLQNPVNDQDAATKYYVDNVVQGLNIHGSVDYATTGTLAVASGGTTSYNNGSSGVGATITTTGTFLLIDGGNVQNVTTRILVKNEANAAWNGIYTWANATALVRATDFNSSADISGGDFTFVKLGTVNADSGWVQTTDNVVVGVSNIVWTQFSGAGTYTAGTGLTLTGTTFSVNASQTQITTVGTLGSLSVSGNANVGNIGATFGVFTNVSGNGSTLSSITGGNVTGQVGNALVAGTVYTAAQPNITSTGTLTSLGVSGTVTASTLVSNVATGTAPLTVTSTTRVSNLNVAYANVADNINVSAGTGNNYLIFASAATGNVSEVTSTGLLANLSNNSITATTFVGALSGAATTAGSATTAGTVTTAAQPNITSVGTLTGLTVSSTISGSINGSAASATTAGTVTTAAQPNITSVGTLTSLTLSGTLSGAVQIGSGAATHFGTTLTTGANTTAGTVTGNWTLSAGSRWNASYADLSEKYVADADYGPGTVLIFGGEHEVTISNELNTTRVAGVITTNAAYTMNSGLEAEFVADVALQGRVPVKVIGPIYKGDLLVSGGNGHAIANNNARAGTIIGKSLENFTDTTGVIEVAVGRF